MAPKYKLTYFDSRGRAEHIRFLFAYAGVEYEDVRVPREKWPQLKRGTPFGMLPILEVDGQPVCQSMAIARYLANEFGLAGKDNWEKLKCDELVDTLSDLKQVLITYHKENDAVKKEELKVKLMKETVPYYLKRFEKIISANGGYTVGDSLTWTDFVFAASLENFEVIFGKDSLSMFPSLRKLQTKIFELPAIKEWISKRPNTEF